MPTPICRRRTNTSSIRVSLPNRNYDPKKGAALYDRYIDEWLIAEDEGVEIMLNEHHQTATCVDPAAPLVLAALARLTKKARLLILGNPVANRRQPVRVAEEMAMATNDRRRTGRRSRCSCRPQPRDRCRDWRWSWRARRLHSGRRLEQGGIQRHYDMAYASCMTSHGNEVAGWPPHRPRWYRRHGYAPPPSNAGGPPRDMQNGPPPDDQGPPPPPPSGY